MIAGTAVLAVMAVTAAALGALVPAHGPFVLLGLAALMAGGAVVARPVYGLWMVIATMPLSSALAIGSVSLGRLIGAGVIGVWLVRRLAARTAWRPLGRVGFYQASAALLMFVFASAIWATYPFDTFTGLGQLALLVLLAVVVAEMASSLRVVTQVVRVLVFAGAVAAAIVLEQYYVEGVRRAGSGVAGGINGTAAALVTIVPFAWYLVQSSARPFWSALGVIYIGAASLAVITTFSRSSYLMLAVTAVAVPLLTFANRGGRRWLLGFGGAVALAAALMPDARVVERVKTIGPVLAELLGGGEASGPAGDSRAFHWAVGWQMFRDSPIVGVGYNNYGRLFRDHYQFQVSATHGSNNRFGYGSLRDPHSSYLSFLATGGLVGVALYGALLLTIACNLKKGWTNVGRSVRSGPGVLVAMIACAFAMQIVYGLTLTVHQDRLFWLIGGLSVAVARLTAAERHGRLANLS